VLNLTLTYLNGSNNSIIYTRNTHISPCQHTFGVGHRSVLAVVAVAGVGDVAVGGGLVVQQRRRRRRRRRRRWQRRLHERERALELRPPLLERAVVADGHADEPRRDARARAVLGRYLAAGAAPRAGHERLVVAQADGHEPELGGVLEVVHEAVGAVLGAHVDAEHPAGAVPGIGRGGQARVVRVVGEARVEHAQAQALHPGRERQRPARVLLHPQRQVRQALRQLEGHLGVHRRAQQHQRPLLQVHHLVHQARRPADRACMRAQRYVPSDSGSFHVVHHTRVLAVSLVRRT
jgi:hypothetical protein